MADLTNDSAESLGFSEGLSNSMAQAFAEGLQLHAFCPATPYYIGGDFGVYTGALDEAAVAEFIRSRSPLGYSPFRDFVAGEYKFQKAYVDFVFRPIDGADAQLSLSEAAIYADAPDRSETDIATITNASTGISITFSPAFATAPKVTLTPIASGSPVVAVLTATPTASGFTAKLFNLSGTAVTGSLIWSATGY